MEFEAVVPYDYTYRLIDAVDLKNIPNIKQLALKRIREIRDLYEKGDVETYWRMVFANIFNMPIHYIKLQKKFQKILKMILKYLLLIKNRKFSSIDNYVSFSSAEGKTVMVLDRDTRESVLKCSYTDEQGFECEDELTMVLCLSIVNELENILTLILS